MLKHRRLNIKLKQAWRWSGYLGLGVHRGSVLQQELRHLVVSCPGRHVERGLHFLEKWITKNGHTRLLQRHPGSRDEQLPVPRWRFETHHVGGAGWSSSLQQDLHDVQVTHEGRHVQGCQARLRSRKDESITLDKFFSTESVWRARSHCSLSLRNLTALWETKTREKNANFHKSRI